MSSSHHKNFRLKYGGEILEEAITELINFVECDIDLGWHDCSSFNEYIEEVWQNMLPNKKDVSNIYTRTFVSSLCQNSKKEYSLTDLDNALYKKYKYSIKEFLLLKYS